MATFSKYRWVSFNEFKRAHMSNFAEQGTGAQKTANTEGNVSKVQNFVFADRRSKTCKRAEKTKHGSIGTLVQRPRNSRNRALLSAKLHRKRQRLSFGLERCWNSQSVICIDCLEKVKTVVGLYYVELLGRIAGKSVQFVDHILYII